MGGLSCGGSCMKYILFLFNIAFFITGAAMLGVGIWLKVDPEAATILDFVTITMKDQQMDYAIGLLIGIGAFIFLVGFLGCCGACKESSCMLCLYAGLLILVFMLEIAVAILAIVYKGKISEELKKTMQKQVKQDVTQNNTDLTTLIWNNLQHSVKCCGAYNATDYADNTNFNAANPIPKSCCVITDFDEKNPKPENWPKCKEEYDNKVTNGEQLYYKGCYDGISEWINKHTGILIGIGFGIGIIQLLGIVFACCVRGEINDS